MLLAELANEGSPQSITEMIQRNSINNGPPIKKERAKVLTLRNKDR